MATENKNSTVIITETSLRGTACCEGTKQKQSAYNKEIASAKELRNDVRVPKLRFKEFDGDWEYSKLGEKCNHISYGLTVRPKFVVKGIPLISAREIRKGKVNISKAPKISLEDFNKLSDKAKPKKGDLFLTKTGTIGFTARFSEDFPIAITQNIAVIRLNDILSNSPLYLMQYFKTKMFYRSAISKVNQSTIMDLQLGDIRKLEIPYPTFQEQQKIATFLTAVDDKIQQLTKKKTLLEQYKKGVMQQIFSQQLRFKPDETKQNDITKKTVIANDSEAISNSKKEQNSLDAKTSFPDWEEKKLGEVCEITTGKLDANAMVENGKYRFYTCAKKYFFIDNYAFDTDALIISGNGANVGYVHHFKGKFNAYQRTYVLDKIEQNIFFMRHFLDKFLYKRIFKEKKDGNTPYIVLSTLSEMKINLPSLKEQQKIATYLSAIDTKIENVQTQIAKTQTFKKGLLQQMFV